MEQHTDDLDRLKDRLRQIPEREVPAGLNRRIMGRILLAPERYSPVGRLQRWLTGMVDVFSARQAIAAVAMVSLAFWLGTLVGSGDGQQETAPAPQVALSPVKNSARANYLIGRGLLEAGEQDLALTFFSRAAAQDPRTAEFGHWQGVAYWQLGNREQERRSYEESLERRPDHLPTLLNLGHNLFENGDFRQALRQYDEALRINPLEQAALYNRALVQLQLGAKEEARMAFRRYLDHYRTDRRAWRSVEHLERLGDYSYRVCPLGSRKVVVDQEVLLGPPLPARQLELERIARWLDRVPEGELHLVVYIQGDGPQGRAIAEELRQQLQANRENNVKMPVNISWFDQPLDEQAADGRSRQRQRGLLLFTQAKTNQGGKV